MAVLRALGVPDPTLVEEARARVAGEILQFVATSLKLWAQSGFVRAGDDEACCAARFFGILLDVIDDKSFYSAVWEGTQLNPQMLAGLAHPKHAKRIDVVVYAGPIRALNAFPMECKRLGHRGSALEYVKNGMIRFISGSYGGDVEEGGMIGFVFAQKPPVCAQQINASIGRQKLGASHELTAALSAGGVAAEYNSRHCRTGQTDMKLTHILVEVI